VILGVRARSNSCTAGRVRRRISLYLGFLTEIFNKAAAALTARGARSEAVIGCGMVLMTCFRIRFVWHGFHYTIWNDWVEEDFRNHT
jgi:hypothetical protein